MYIWLEYDVVEYDGGRKMFIVCDSLNLFSCLVVLFLVDMVMFVFEIIW